MHMPAKEGASSCACLPSTTGVGCGARRAAGTYEESDEEEVAHGVGIIIRESDHRGASGGRSGGIRSGCRSILHR
jgi:hypothetical protein